MVAEFLKVSSSEPYKLSFSCEPTFHLAFGGEPDPLPDDVKAAVNEELTKLASDPFGIGRQPPCPPHTPIGLFHDFRLTVDGKRFKFWLLFVADDVRREIAVREFNIMPQLF
jgi:hypothetical protein